MPPPPQSATQISSSPQILEVGSLSSSSSNTSGENAENLSAGATSPANKDPENFVTLDSLISKLFSVRDSDVDAEFMETFVLSMNIFIDPEEFLGIVIDQLNEASMNLDDEEEQIVKRRVFKILTYWVKELWNYTISPKAIEIVRNFTEDYQLVDESDELIELVDKMTLKGVGELNIAVKAGGIPTPQHIPAGLYLGCNEELPEVNLLNYSPIELAKQLTIVESALFRRLKAWEFQGLRFSKKDNMNLAPNVYSLSAHFNKVSMWIARNIMGVSGMANNNWPLRARIIEKAIELGSELQKLQNYNGVYEVISACASTAVTRLKRSWEYVSPRHVAILDELDAMMTPEKNYASFRRRLETTKPPCIPFIGLYQTDMTFAEDGNKTEMEGYVNWYKCKLQASILSNLHRYQRDLYPLTPVPFLIEFFTERMPVVSEDDIWALTQEIEPRGSGNASHKSSDSNGGGSSHSKSGSRTYSISATSSMSLSGGASTSPASTPRSLDGLSGSRTSIISKFQFKEYNCVAPGVTGFIRVPLSRSLRGVECKQAILELCMLRGVGLSQEEFDKARGNGYKDLKLVVYSAKRPYSRVVGDDFTLGEVDTELRYLALCRSPNTVHVLFPKVTNGGLVDNGTGDTDLEGHFGFDIHADYDATDGAGALLRAIAETIGIAEPMSVIHYCSRGGKLRWLNRNFTLREQKFLDKDLAIVICPQTHFIEASECVLKKRNAYFFNKECKHKDGNLTKAKSSNISSTTFPKGMFSEAATASPLMHSGSSLSNLNVEIKDKNKWLVAVDNMLLVFKDIGAKSPSKVYLLDCYDVSLATVGKSAREAIILREAADSPFTKPGSKRKPVAFTAATTVGGSDVNGVRGWFSDLLTRSKVNIRTRSFGMPLREIAKRDGKLPIPRFVRNWFDFCVGNAVALRNAFSEPASQALLDAFRAEVEAGRTPQPVNEEEIVAYAQLGLLFLCDLPTPLIHEGITKEFMTVSATTAYSRMKAPRLKELLFRHLGQAEAATLFAYLTYFRLWADHSGAGIERAAWILSRVLFGSHEAQKLQAVGFTEEMLETVLDLDLLSRPPEEDTETKAKAAEASNYKINAPHEQTIVSELDVTVFYKDEQKKLEFLIKNYDKIASCTDTLRINDGVSSFNRSYSSSTIKRASSANGNTSGKNSPGHSSSPNTSPNQSLTYGGSHNQSPKSVSPLSSPSSSLTNNSGGGSGSGSLTMPQQSSSMKYAQQSAQNPATNPSLMSKSSRTKLSFMHKK